jgi:hypothetical protein
MAFSKRVGVLWVHDYQGQDGQTRKYMSGYIDNGIWGNIPIAIFRLENKQNGNGPDYHIVLSEPKKEETGSVVPDPSVPF